MGELIRVPFGYVLDFLYQFTTNYGVALILFAIIVRLVLIPVNAKSKKSMMKMSRMQPKIQEIQRKYADDKQKQNEAIQKLQQEEGASMGCGGCLWSLVPLLLLLPLYQVVRQPIVYMLHESADVANVICNTMGIDSRSTYAQLFAIGSADWQANVPAVQAALEEAGLALANPNTLNGLNFDFLHIDLGQIPSWKVWTWSAWTWNSIGGLLIPLLSCGSQVLQMWLSQRTNNSLVTDKNGMEDKETAQNAKSAQQGKLMMWMMPLMSLFIGFTVPVALSLYWFVGGVVSMIENHFMTKHYRKVYDAEDAARLQRYLEQQAIEEEKERVRAERRAANPDGITDNTSKKKLQQKQRAEEEAARAAAKREYNAKRGIVEETEEVEKETMSGIPERPYCKGRAYDPDRYKHSED